MRWLHFILSHSIFVSICAVALSYQTCILLQIAPDNYLYGLIFFSTLSSYNFYWLVSKYYFSGNRLLITFLKAQYSNVSLLIIAAVGLLYCLMRLPGVLFQILVAVSFTLLYSLPLWPIKQAAFFRKAGFLKTVLLSFTWTYVTVMIPPQQSFVNHFALGLLFSTRFLFMLMLCIIFDSRDIQVDKLHGLKSLATDVNQKTLKMMMGIAFILYIVSGFFLRYYFENHAQIIAFLVTGAVTLLVYRLSLKKQVYFFYYFLVDGLMLFSAIATYVASI